MFLFILIFSVFFMSDINAEDKVQTYDLFPKYWPVHNEIKLLDKTMKEYIQSTGEKSMLLLEKWEKSYRVYNWLGIISINVDKNNKCEINYHRFNKDSVYQTSFPITTHFSISGIENCEFVADLKTLQDIVSFSELSLPAGFLSGHFLWPSGMNIIEARNIYGGKIYRLKVTWNIKEVETLVNYYKKMSKLFKKHGININADFSPY